jgi:hypothetical protein
MALRPALLVSALTAACCLAAAEKQAQKASAPDAAFESLKLLAGDWVGKNTKGSHASDMEVKANYKITSGGTTIVETLGAGSDHEMVTVIHKDGNDLVLTHYCMLGNQPRMKADGSGDAKKVAFKFAGGSNMKSDKDMHMHAVTYTLQDKDNLTAEWLLYVDGKPAETAVFVFKQKK